MILGCKFFHEKIITYKGNSYHSRAYYLLICMLAGRFVQI